MKKRFLFFALLAAALVVVVVLGIQLDAFESIKVSLPEDRSSQIAHMDPNLSISPNAVEKALMGTRFQEDFQVQVFGTFPDSEGLFSRHIQLVEGVRAVSFFLPSDEALSSSPQRGLDPSLVQEAVLVELTEKESLGAGEVALAAADVFVFEAIGESGIQEGTFSLVDSIVEKTVEAAGGTLLKQQALELQRDQIVIDGFTHISDNQLKQHNSSLLTIASVVAMFNAKEGLWAALLVSGIVIVGCVWIYVREGKN